MNMVQETANIINKIHRDRFYVDDHTGKEETLQGYVVLVKGTRDTRDGKQTLDVCPVYKNEQCCLNGLYISHDNKVHLSTASVGGIYDPKEKYTGIGRIVDTKWF